DRLALLELAVLENPHEARPSHYLGREYFYRGDYSKAEAELKRHLTLEQGAWHGDRAASMRFLGWIENRRKNPTGAIAWFLREAAESPGDRGPWVDLAQAYHDAGNVAGCYFAARQALSIAQRPRDVITYGYAWGERPYDLAALAAWRLGLKDEARAFGEAALKLASDDARLKNNLDLMRGR
ncbi:MAG: tetratricopeptide repeat protein, partial [Planctomycetes bacterium]|nr:tetratricopeptide repeat protein [Planctomycetota bacterium]